MTSEQSERERLSTAEGGRGQASYFVTRISQENVPTLLGRSPGAGVNCTVSLQMNGDVAYYGAVVQFYAEQAGKVALFDTQVLTTAQVNNNPTLLLSTGTCAADSWEVYVTLTAGIPAARLNSAVSAFGVEMAGLGGGGGTYTGAAPIEVTGTVISIDPAYTPWVQVGGTGGVIEAIDATASVQASGGAATAGQLAAAFAGSSASGLGSFAAAQGFATGDYSFAAGGFSNGNYSAALGDSANAAADRSFAGAGGFADNLNSVSFHEMSSSVGGSDFTSGAGTSLGPYGFSHGGYAGVSGGSYDIAFGSGSTADGGFTFAVGGGTVSAAQGFAHAMGQAVAVGAAGFNQMLAREPWAFAAGVPGVAAIEVGNDITGTAVNITAGLFGIFGATPVPQQLGGAMTAGAVYTSVEQGMLQTAYNALIAFGYLSP